MTSPDIFDQSIYSTQSYNRYSYALNNPLKYTDPSGYYWRKVTYFTEARIVGYAKISGWDYLFPIDGFIDHSIWINYSFPGFDYVNEFSSGGHIGGGGPGSGISSGGSATGNNPGDVDLWVKPVIEYTSKTTGVVGILTKARELVEWEYLRQAKFNRALSGDFSQPVKNSLRALKNTGKVLGYAGIALSGVDMAVNGVNVSNSLDLIMGGVAFVPGVGWAVSGLYFVGNFGWQAYSGNSIGESIQSNFTDSNASWKPW
jgi:hypothetical protein